MRAGISKASIVPRKKAKNKSHPYVSCPVSYTHLEYEMRYNNMKPREATFAAMQKVQSPVIGVAVVLAAVFLSLIHI